LLPFSDEWMRLDGPACASVRLGQGGLSLADLQQVDIDVPGRAAGRTKWHRERYCIVSLMRHWLAVQPSRFPATLIRQESPDFVLRHDDSGRKPIAIEVSDFGTEEYQEHLSNEARRGAATTKRGKSAHAVAPMASSSRSTATSAIGRNVSGPGTCITPCAERCNPNAG
jgi:hypothetical protein